MSEPIAAIYPHLLAFVYGRPWAMHEATLNVVLDILGQRMAGLRASPDEITERLAAAARQNGPRSGGGRRANVAVIPVYGVITPRANMLSSSSGGSTAEDIRKDFRAALADPEVGSIVFDVDSPGGVVDGLPELTAEIMDARGRKPMTAVANTQMASGALWIASAADRIVASPSATVGSIGVIGVHQDRSAKYEREGIRHTIIRTSRYKGEAHDSEPLTDDAKKAMLDEAMHYDAMFTEDVARGRGVDPARVRAEFGQGRMMVAKKAVEVGLIDGIQTLESAVRDSAMRSGGAAAYGAVLAAEVEDAILANAEVQVVSTITQTVDLETDHLPFAERLALATEELEAVAGIARDRAARRVGDGRPLSQHTREHLLRVRAAVEALVTEPVEEPVQARRVASTDVLNLMLRQYEEK